MITAISLISCRTAFPEAQTPDDVYYSPEGMRNDEERTQTDEDRYLRMKVRNRRDWSELNDWYTYERWSYGMNYAYGTPYHPYYNWNVYHNPYWMPTAGTRTENRPRISNLNAFQAGASGTSPRINPVNPKLSGFGGSNPNSNNGTNIRSSTPGGALRELFGHGTTNSSSPNPTPSSSNPTSPPAPSAPVRKF